MPQAPSASWRAKSCGLTVVLPAGEHVDPFDRGSQRPELEVRGGGEFVEDVADRLTVDERVGEHDAIETVAAADLELLHRRHGDAPGAVGELAREELRAHRRLAVRRDAHAAGAAQEVHHPGAVVRDRALLQHGERERQVAAQHVPALPPDVAEPEGRAAAGHALRSEEHTSELQSLMRISYAV